MTISPVTEIVPPTAHKYQRTVITTARRKAPEPVPADLTLTRPEVQALSKALKDSGWYARQRLAALKGYMSLPMPGMTEEAWRRTDIRTFKWDQVHLPLPATRPGKLVPASLLKPLVGAERGGLLV